MKGSKYAGVMIVGSRVRLSLDLEEQPIIRREVMRNIFCTVKMVLAAIIWCVIFSCDKDNNIPCADKITFLCADIPPYIYEKDGRLTGSDIDIFRAASEIVGINPAIVKHDDWDDAYCALKDEGMSAILSTSYLPDRKNQFKWAGPFNSNSFYILTSKDININSLDEAKELGSIAVVEGWEDMLTLEKLGFTNLIYCNTFEETIRKVNHNEADAFVSYDRGNNIVVDGAGYQLASDFNVLLAYHTAYYYLAFSLDVPDKIVQSYQNAIDQLIDKGTVTRYRNEYIPGHLLSFGKIQLFTESSPPLNMMNTIADAIANGGLKFDGSSVEVVNEIQSRLGVNFPLIPSLWFNSYAIVQYLPCSALFSTIRTREREKMFQWVGPIAESESLFCVSKDSNISLNSLADAKNYKTAVVRDWAAETTLIEHGFTNLVNGDDPQSTFELFTNGEAELLFIDGISIPSLMEENKLEMKDYETFSFFDSYSYFIAFSLETPASVVNDWQNTLDQMKGDGSFKTIWDKWYPGISVP